MAIRRERTVVVGAFVVGTGVILLIGVLWLAGSRFLRPVDRYHVIFNGSVSGLSPGAAVELNGVQVGKVTTVNLTDDSPPRVDVDIEVKPNTPIYQDSVAQLTGNFVTGIQFIELTGGRSESGKLGEDQAIQSQEGAFADVRRQAVELSKETYELVRGLNEDTLNQQNRAAFSQTIQDLAATSRNLRSLSDDLAEPHRLQQLNVTLANMNEVSANLKQASGAIAQRSGETIDRVNEVLVKLSRVADSAQTMLTSTNGVLNRNYQDVDRTLMQVNSASHHLDDALQMITADPSILVWGRRNSTREEDK